MNQYEEHCEYELNAQADYESELWASDRESMKNEGYWAECEFKEEEKMKSELLKEAWNKISVPDDCDESCPYLLETTDGFSTGDSPSVYECTCRKPEGCPIIENFISEHFQIINIGGE